MAGRGFVPARAADEPLAGPYAAWEEALAATSSLFPREGAAGDLTLPAGLLLTWWAAG